MFYYSSLVLALLCLSSATATSRRRGQEDVLAEQVCDSGLQAFTLPQSVGGSCSGGASKCVVCATPNPLVITKANSVTPFSMVLGCQASSWGYSWSGQGIQASMVSNGVKGNITTGSVATSGWIVVRGCDSKGGSWGFNLTYTFTPPKQSKH